MEQTKCSCGKECSCEKLEKELKNLRHFCVQLIIDKNKLKRKLAPKSWRDKEARKLRNFLLMQNCNQHTIIKCTLPLKYIHTEVGDVVRFDDLNNNTKAYGEHYTKDGIIRNGQIIHPYFIITSVTKSSKDIKIECMQLHNLERTFTAGAGSLTRRSEKGLHALLEQDTGEEQFVERWGWFGVMYRLTNGDFSQLQGITERPLLEALTWLSYELDLNETQKVNYEHRRNTV